MRLEPLNVAAGRIGLVLFLLMMTQANDVCQYIWGKSIGRRKILPKVSPNKTWGGFLGGFATITLAAGWIAPYLTPLTTRQGLSPGPSHLPAGFAGDVVISSVSATCRSKTPAA
ncbi:MAG: phosphatidate cytidylyltransferase [Pirellulales bacterium]